MFECSVTAATLDDLPMMVNLLDVLFTQERDFTPNPILQVTALSAFLADARVGKLFVAKDENASVIGMVSLLFTVSTATGGRAAWLEDLVVLPSMRSKGVGTRLLEHAIDWARRHDIKRITLLTDADNEPAQSLYLRKGFMRSHMVPMRLHLD
jgi:GNAT superfamily N-acetyltransferase